MTIKRVPLKLGWHRPRPKRWIEIDTDTGKIVRRDDWDVHDKQMRQWLRQRIKDDDPSIDHNDEATLKKAWCEQSARVRREFNLTLEWEEKA